MACLEVLEKLLALGLLPESLTEFDEFPEIFEGRPFQRLAVLSPPPLKLRIAKQLQGDLSDNGLQGHACRYYHRMGTLDVLNSTFLIFSFLFTFNKCYCIYGSAWLSSLASLLFANQEEEDADENGGSSSPTGVMFCYYKHNGCPTKQNGEPVLIEELMNGRPSDGFTASGIRRSEMKECPKYILSPKYIMSPKYNLSPKYMIFHSPLFK